MLQIGKELDAGYYCIGCGFYESEANVDFGSEFCNNCGCAVDDHARAKVIEDA